MAASAPAWTSRRSSPARTCRSRGEASASPNDRPRKPIISAVEGFALAGGTELALATDLIVASRDARFGLPEVKRGLVAGGGGLIRLPQRIPYQKAMELALTGDSLTAVEGARLRSGEPADRAG